MTAVRYSTLAALVAAALYWVNGPAFNEPALWRLLMLLALFVGIVAALSWIYLAGDLDHGIPADEPDEHDLALVAAHYELAAQDLEALAADVGWPAKYDMECAAKYLRARAVGHRIAAAYETRSAA